MALRLTEKSDIRIFILYLLMQVDSRIDFVTLHDIAVQDEFVNPFDFMEEFYELQKIKALELLDRMALKMIEAEDLNALAFKLPFMTETLVKNGVISKEEAITLNNKYNALCMRKIQDKVVSE